MLEVLGIVSETFVRRRYAEELEKAQRDLFGERKKKAFRSYGINLRHGARAAFRIVQSWLAKADRG